MLNAANEIAVAAFLQERLGFTGIAEVIRHTMDAFEDGNAGARVEGLADVRLIDGWARAFALRHRGLDVDRAAHSVLGGGELRQHAVAGGLHDPSTVQMPGGER